MPPLELEDFGASQEKPNSDEMSKEEIEQYYQSQIKKLKLEYENKIKEIYKKAFDEGFEKGEKETKEKLNNEFNEKLKKELKRQEEHLQAEYVKLKKDIVSVLSELGERYRKHIQFTDELIISVLEEIMEYLYIDPSNMTYIAEELKSIIDDAKVSPKVRVEVSPILAPYFKNVASEIEVIENNKLKGGDFVVKMENAQFENKFKEKIKILKDEIKREIKKNSPL